MAIVNGRNRGANMITGTIARIRRNHGLEHATIHVLSEGHKRFSAQGNSDHRGFHLNIYGDVTGGRPSQLRYGAGDNGHAGHPGRAGRLHLRAVARRKDTLP